MGNYVIVGVGNYVIENPSNLGNYVIADTWRAYLDADQFTAAILREQYSDEDLFVGDEEGALFASGHKFAGCNTAVAASELAETLVRQMTAVVRLIDSRCSSIAYLDRVRDDSPGGVTHIFGRVEMRAFSRLTVGGHQSQSTRGCTPTRMMILTSQLRWS